MLNLTLALTAFVGTHFLMSHPLRSPMAFRLGAAGFQIVYSLVSFATLGWAVYAFREAPLGMPLWSAGDGLNILATAIMFVASVLLAGSFIGNPALPQPGAATLALQKPAGVFAITRHPMMWSFAFWSLAHVVYTKARLARTNRIDRRHADLAGGNLGASIGGRADGGRLDLAGLKPDHLHASFGVTRSRCSPARRDCIESSNIFCAESNIDRGDAVLHRNTALGAGDRHNIVPLRQQPCEGNLRLGHAMCIGNGANGIDHFQILGQVFRRIAWVVATPVVSGQLVEAADCACQKPTP